MDSPGSSIENLIVIGASAGGVIGQSKKNPKTYEFLSTELAALKENLCSIQKLLDLASASADERLAAK